MSANILLNRLQKVKRTGDGKWMACCPAHQDRTASLAITELPDGRILLNCFSSCDTYSILKSVGLDWKDVFPDSLAGHRVNAEPKILYATEALEIVKFEAQIVCIIAYDIIRNKPMTAEMSARLSQAMQTINKALEASK